MTDNSKSWQLNLYELHRKPLQVKTRPEASSEISIPASRLSSLLTCPICLDMLESTMVTKDCLHRFCADCITTALRRGNQECPTCRKKLVSRRCLRPDPNFDSLINKLFPKRKENCEREQLELQTLVSRHAENLHKTAASRGVLQESSESGSIAPKPEIKEKVRGRKRKSTAPVAPAIPEEEPSGSTEQQSTRDLAQPDDSEADTSEKIAPAAKSPKVATKKQKSRSKSPAPGKSSQPTNASDSETEEVESVKKKTAEPQSKKRKKGSKKPVDESDNEASGSEDPPVAAAKGAGKKGKKIKAEENTMSDEEGTASKQKPVKKTATKKKMTKNSDSDVEDDTEAKKKSKHPNPTKNQTKFAGIEQASSCASTLIIEESDEEALEDTQFHFFLNDFGDKDASAELIATSYKATLDHVADFVAKKIVLINVRKFSVEFGFLLNRRFQKIQATTDTRIADLYKQRVDDGKSLKTDPFHLHFKVVKKS